MPLLDLFVNRANRRQTDARREALADVIPSGLHVNAVEIGADDTEEWVRIVPFGSYPFHHSGGHEITRAHGEQMVANFEQRPGGLLFDIDHASLWGTTKAAAWSSALEVREDGVYCRRPELTAYGTAEVADRQYCFWSPVYALSAVNKRGDQIGAVLLSCAYTNTPYFNEGEIDVVPNSVPQPPGPVNPETLALLGLPADATDDQIANAVSQMHARVNAAPAQLPPDAPAPATPPAGASSAPAVPAVEVSGADSDAAARLAALEAKVNAASDATKAAQVDALVDGAIARGAIRPADRAVFQNAARADYDATKQDLDGRADGAAVPGGLRLNRQPSAVTTTPGGTLRQDTAAYVNAQLGRTA